MKSIIVEIDGSTVGVRFDVTEKGEEIHTTDLIMGVTSIVSAIIDVSNSNLEEVLKEIELCSKAIDSSKIIKDKLNE